MRSALNKYILKSVNDCTLCFFIKDVDLIKLKCSLNAVTRLSG